MNKYWQLFWKFRAIHLMRMMEYRGDFIFWTVVSLMWTGFQFLFFHLLLNVSDTIGGWTRYEIYALLGIYMTIDSLTWSFFANNMREYKRAIYDGSLSRYLIKPISPIFMTLTQTNSYNNVPRFLVGVLTVGWALSQLGVTPSLWQLLGAIGLWLVSASFLYAGWFLVTTGAFWAERLDNITEIMPALRSFYNYPRTIYTGLAQTILVYTIPIAAVASLPAEVLLARTDWGLISFFVIFTLGLATISHWFFHYSIKKYISVGG